MEKIIYLHITHFSADFYELKSRQLLKGIDRWCQVLRRRLLGHASLLHYFVRICYLGSYPHE